MNWSDIKSNIVSKKKMPRDLPRLKKQLLKQRRNFPINKLDQLVLEEPPFLQPPAVFFLIPAIIQMTAIPVQTEQSNLQCSITIFQGWIKEGPWTDLKIGPQHRPLLSLITLEEDYLHMKKRKLRLRCLTNWPGKPTENLQEDYFQNWRHQAHCFPLIHLLGKKNHTFVPLCTYLSS